MATRKTQKKTPFETQLTWLSLAASVPILLLLIWVMIYAGISIYLTILTAFIGMIVVALCNLKLHQKSSYQFRSLSNLLDAMIQGDYSLRVRRSDSPGALNELVDSINGLAQRLATQRRDSIESQLLLRTVIDHIEVAIIALSSENKLVFVNPAAEKLLRLDKKKTDELLVTQLTEICHLKSGHNQVVTLTMGQLKGRFNIHLEEFRQQGEQQKLLFITDVRTLLRTEERKAWQGLVRVISHEINNSLAPIASISQTLSKMTVNSKLEDELSESLQGGLKIVEQRAASLNEFINSYRQLARLPEPELCRVSIRKLFDKLAILFEGQIQIRSDQDVKLMLDVVQIEQVLINIIKNGIEACQAAKRDPMVTIQWYTDSTNFNVIIEDQGNGISNPDNLFVPFYTTKKQGSGIGLVLCRQIIESHKGLISLDNRPDKQGCRVNLELPYI